MCTSVTVMNPYAGSLYSRTSSSPTSSLISDATRSVRNDMVPGPPLCQRAGRLDDAIGLDDVANLDVVEVLEPDAALKAGLDVPDVVLEPLERCQRSVEGHDAVPDQADLVASADPTVLDVAAGDGAGLADLENFPDLDRRGDFLVLLRRKEPFEGLLHVLDGVV